jgi:protein ImuB
VAARVLAVWCPDWPVTAMGFAASAPAAVVHGGQVVAASAAARRAGVARGQRHREAAARCPGLVAVARDPAREARVFELVVAAVAALVPRVEVTRPGLLALPVRGAARYFSGEPRLRDQVAEAARTASGVPGAAAPVCGVADGRFAAALAARHATIVPPGESGRFLAPFPVTVLGQPRLAGLLGRLGIRTMGQFAALPAAAVLARFGPAAARAHALAQGLDEEPLRTVTPAGELAAATRFDPPAGQAGQVAFAARSLAVKLAGMLAARGLACTQLRIEIGASDGAQSSRLWHADNGLSAQAMADRVRWQLDGWLPAVPAVPSSDGPAGVTVLHLAAGQTAPAGRQLALWGEATDADMRAARGIDRLRGMLGTDAVLTGVVRGGRDPATRSALVPWGEPGSDQSVALPWPGRLPAPAPALIHRDPVPAQVLDAAGRPVGVSGRGEITGEPARMSLGGRWQDIVAWGGPWTADERWWDAGTGRRRARFQLLTAGQAGYLCAVEGGRWWIEAAYG